MKYKPENVKLVITHNGVEQNYYFNEKVESSNDQAYDDGYAEAIRDVVFELNNQDVDSDVIALIDGT